MKKALFLAVLIVTLQMTLSSQNKTDALILINGKVSNAELSSIDPNTIESMTVIKDQAAIDIYGEAAKNGVILVITKDFARPVRYDSAKYQPSKALIILDGEIYKSGLNSIHPDEISTISVLNDLSATKAYGEAGKNGVILITSKRNKLKK
jgi:TonB-dependent SusC/RagA subfamily outer membrane receptor